MLYSIDLIEGFLNSAAKFRRPIGININVVPILVLMFGIAMSCKLVPEYGMSS